MFVAEKEAEIKELVARLHQERSETQVQKQLLQHLIRTQVNLQLIDEPGISQVIDVSEGSHNEGTRTVTELAFVNTFCILDMPD